MGSAVLELIMPSLEMMPPGITNDEGKKKSSIEFGQPYRC
jgi:hypothetical protein